MTGRVLAGIGAALAGVVLMCTGLVGVVVPSVPTAALADCPAAGATPTTATARTGAAGPVSPTVVPITAAGGYPRMGRWDPPQVANAATVITVGSRLQIPPRGWVIAVATAMQESDLTNLFRGPDDSVGLFQQRPSQGWGPAAALRDPAHAAALFYTHLQAVPGWRDLPLTAAAQAVQRSALPDAYAQKEAQASALVTALTGRTDLSSCGIPTSTGGWTQPAHGPIGSGFRPPDRPSHAGVDIVVARYTLIRAASAGTVVTATCNVSTGTCDQDGGLQVMGCGWYVEIAHTTSVTTRYCHMVARPLVTVGQRVVAGQPLGRVGTSGNSTGPHLHFETRVNGVPVDPIPFMAARGAPLQ